MKIKNIIFILFLSLVPGCNSFVGVEEIIRYTSPDSRVDAVVVTADAGSTSSTAFHVFIVPKGSPHPKDLDYAVFTADKVEALNVYWQETKYLKVTYKDARIFKFTNFWQSRNIDNFGYIVKITEAEQKHLQGPGDETPPGL